VRNLCLCLYLGTLLLFALASHASAECVASTRRIGSPGLQTIFLKVSGLPDGLRSAFRNGYQGWNRQRCNTAEADFPLFLERSVDGSRRVEVHYQEGFNPHNNRSCGRWQDGVVWLYGRAYWEERVVSCTRALEFTDTVTHELGHVLGLADSTCTGWAMSPRVYGGGSYVDRYLRPAECELVDRTHRLEGEVDEAMPPADR